MTVASHVRGSAVTLSALWLGCAGAPPARPKDGALSATAASSPSSVGDAGPDAVGCNADVRHDRSNCGHCGVACAANAVCVSGQCLTHGGLAAGWSSACAVSTDGRGRVECWGDDRMGQAGQGRLAASVAPRAIDGLEDVVELASSGQHVCARTSAGDVYCWGRLDEEAGHRAPVLRPTRVDGLSDVHMLDASGHHTCALWGNGRVSCWGEGQDGVLGGAAPGYQGSPIEVPWDHPFEGVATSWDFSCAWDRDGHVVCWGGIPIVVGRTPHYSGTTPGYAPSSPPRMIRTVPDLSRVVLGPQSFCALDRSGRAGCWGWPTSIGELPALDTRDGPLPPIVDAADLALEGDGICALSRDGRVRCQERGQPKGPADIGGAVALAAGSKFFCMRQQDDGVACWGENGSGELGDATLEPHDYPRPIAAVGAGQEVSLQGDACESGAGCELDDPCDPSRCVRSTWVDPARASCSPRAPSPGSCVCREGRCALHRSATPEAPAAACTDDLGCSLDEGGGRCVVSRRNAGASLSVIDEGPQCRCDASTRRCEYRWFDAVSCKVASDCELSRDSPKHVVGRSRGLPARTPPRCEGGSLACVDQVCRYVRSLRRCD